MNLLVQQPSGVAPVVVGIDQAVTCLKDISETSTPFTMYCNKVSDLIDSMAAAAPSPAAQFDKVKESIANWTGLVVDEQACANMQKGVAQGLLVINQTITSSDIKNLLEKLKSSVTLDYEGIWEGMVKLIYPEFFDGVLKVIADKKQLLLDVVAKQSA